MRDLLLTLRSKTTVACHPTRSMKVSHGELVVFPVSQLCIVEHYNEATELKIKGKRDQGTPDQGAQIPLRRRAGSDEARQTFVYFDLCCQF